MWKFDFSLEVQYIMVLFQPFGVVCMHCILQLDIWAGHDPLLHKS
jgi:hypothetical protein